MINNKLLEKKPYKQATATKKNFEGETSFVYKNNLSD